ncbi:hypothetical protein [Sphingopyxis sp.]|uniref:hypothetical protein n=1 Tax=Sphingopyxis sp. TaxID=1908224 RepID=UPI002D782873|nr:hypothetical protein [Sphingopyxis sp.]HET6525124.1 hypothetical protein [Sphingopyxis sp.]
MAFRRILARLWQNIVLFGEALDHDPQSEMAEGIDRLVAARRKDRAELTAIANRVEALAVEVRGPDEQVSSAG